ncbi:MAG TPA: beta-ketoacyl-ACP synthase 3, partial [Alkalispirochaeta sp.]|nr:beta-ketoacyl-ACP synthase 3 [Alkalispirochaeta sp.]
RHVAARRVTRPDTYVPCNFGNQLEILPSYKRILETAVDLLGGTVLWKQEDAGESGVFDVEAIGSSPSDETVSMVEWSVVVGDTVEEGALLAEVEADKAAAELKSPVSGTVETLLINVGDSVPVGTPIAKIRTATDEPAHVKPLTRENPGQPVITGLSPSSGASSRTGRSGTAGPTDATQTCLIAGVAAQKGSRIVENAEIVTMSPDWEADGIAKRTGIERRPWVAQGETALSLATDAATAVLEQTGIQATDIDMIIFATGTPSSTTPSMAALLQHQLSSAADNVELTCPAYDINAACAGYIYGLQQAWDYLSNAPGEIVLLITSEVLSPRLNMNDAGTAPIFGDAATATILGGSSSVVAPQALAAVDRPVIAAKGESGEALRVPSETELPVTMDGPKVYLEAVKAMMETLSASAEHAELRPDSLDLYVPHQANQRIINAIRQRMKLEPHRMYSNIAENGNTSSSTIPLCLAELLPDHTAGQYWGITAFGGGFTYGATLLRTL